MMTSPNNSGQQTKGRVLRKRISSRRVNRRERVLLSLQVITGTPPPSTPHSLPSNSPAHQPHRSLVTTLRAAEKFEQSHLSTPEVSRLINGAKFFYVEGYFLTHGLDSALEVAKKASETGKVDPRLPFSGTRAVHTCSYFSQVFTLNLSAPFIPQFFKVQLEQIFPYCDFVIGNESEAAAWASAVGLPNKDDIPAIAKSIATLPKSNPSRSRTVIITQGPDSTVVVAATEPDKPKTFSVTRLEDGQIVDTNGAGDAFAGGFLGALVAGKSVDEAVLAGHKLGGMCVQLVSTLETSCFSVS